MRDDTYNLTFDWNQYKPVAGDLEFNDETLRDGLQSPSVRTPDIDERIRTLHLMDDLGIHSVCLGLPGAGPKQAEEIRLLAREIRDCKLSLAPNVACRTLEADIEPAYRISEELGFPLEIAAFIGSSKIRSYVEQWDIEKLTRLTSNAVRYCRERELPVMYVTEDTTRAHPETVKRLYATAVEGGATRICLCDTVGHATPSGVRNLVRFVRDAVLARIGPHVRVDWHGHSDRGLGVWNSMAAIETGVHRIHGTILGIGERCGNTPLDQLLANLKLMQVIDNDLRRLSAYVEFISEITRTPIPNNYPIFGKDAFETATGVHAAAVIKAFKRGNHWLANRIYSGVPADLFGREQTITIGNMSGKSNVIYYLERRGIDPTPEVVDRVLRHAKESDRVLREEEVLALLGPQEG